MGKILALDIGEKRIGAAVSDETKCIAYPLTVIVRNGMESDLRRIMEIVQTHSVEDIVLGLPLNMDGSEGESAGKVYSFRDFLRNKLKIAVQTWDERLTSACAEKSLLELDLSRRKRRKVVDKVAACLILQSFLDHRRKQVGA